MDCWLVCSSLLPLDDLILHFLPRVILFVIRHQYCDWDYLFIVSNLLLPFGVEALTIEVRFLRTCSIPLLIFLYHSLFQELNVSEHYIKYSSRHPDNDAMSLASTHLDYNSTSTPSPVTAKDLTSRRYGNCYYRQGKYCCSKVCTIVVLLLFTTVSVTLQCYIVVGLLHSGVTYPIVSLSSRSLLIIPVQEF